MGRLDDLGTTRSQLFILRREQNRLAELDEVIESSVAAFPWFPVHRAEQALLLAETGRPSEARAVFDDLARDRLAAFHRDNLWLLGLAVTSEVAYLLQEREAARILYDELEPFAELHAVGWEGSMGSVSRYLGLLAETLGDLDSAVRHLEHAEQVNERMGARPWVARTRADLGRVLLRRGADTDASRAHQLLARAQAQAAEMGMVALSAKLGPAGGSEEASAGSVRAAVDHTFHREGEYWVVEFGGSTRPSLRHGKGMGLPGEAAGRSRSRDPRA
jgi:tetratricopeptide (TPR) repeat protein